MPYKDPIKNAESKHKGYLLHKKEYIRKNKLWAKKNPEKMRAYHKKYYEKNKEKHYIRCKTALKIKIPLGLYCQKCGKNLAQERHHPNYLFPLKVVFICRDCHGLIHAHVKDKGSSLNEK